jgi:hypothetical protein
MSDDNNMADVNCRECCAGLVQLAQAEIGFRCPDHGVIKVLVGHMIDVMDRRSGLTAYERNVLAAARAYREKYTNDHPRYSAREEGALLNAALQPEEAAE